MYRQDDVTSLRRMCRNLYSSVVGDVLDRLGFDHQSLPQPIRPLRETTRLIGRAMPVLMVDACGPQKKPLGKMNEALDQLQPDEVYLASGGEMRCAYWGELVTATAKARGAAGAIINGFHRDTNKIVEQNWPVFSRGACCQQPATRTQVVDYRLTIDVGGVRVDPGDLIFGDVDGIVVIPRKVEREVIETALEWARGEKTVRLAVESGLDSTAAFAKFGVA